MTSWLMTIVGTALAPSASSSSYAASSSSTFFASNVCPSRERNSFTRSHARQREPEYTVIFILLV